MHRARRDRDTVGDTKRLRLGEGDFVAEGPNRWAQALFLHAVESCVPEALLELAALRNQDLGPYASDSEPFKAWAEKRGFTDSWAEQHALSNLNVWRAVPETIGRWQVFGFWNWEPQLPPPPSFNWQRETLDAFKRRLDDYRETMKAMPGIVETPVKRTGNLHFEWLAYHHVDGWTQARISEKYQDENGSPSVPAVSLAITETAALAHITLRPMRGRGKFR